MELLLEDFFKERGPGGHGYGRKDIAALMGITDVAIGKMIDKHRPIYVTLRRNKVTGITERKPEKVWFSETSDE